MRQRRKVDSEYIFSVVSNLFIPTVLKEGKTEEGRRRHKERKKKVGNRIDFTSHFFL